MNYKVWRVKNWPIRERVETRKREPGERERTRGNCATCARLGGRCRRVAYTWRAHNRKQAKREAISFSWRAGRPVPNEARDRIIREQWESNSIYQTAGNKRRRRHGIENLAISDVENSARTSITRRTLAINRQRQ